MPQVILNPLTFSATRFTAAQNHAWAQHPPPCLESPGILPCDQGNPCPMLLCAEDCESRVQLKTAIQQNLQRMDIK